MTNEECRLSFFVLLIILVVILFNLNLSELTRGCILALGLALNLVGGQEGRTEKKSSDEWR